MSGAAHYAGAATSISQTTQPGTAEAAAAALAVSVTLASSPTPTSTPAPTFPSPPPPDPSPSPSLTPRQPTPSPISGPAVWEQDIILDTYGWHDALVPTDPGDPVYSYPRLDFGAVTGPVPRAYRAVFIQNRYVRLVVVPELGGRILRWTDRTTGRQLYTTAAGVKLFCLGDLPSELWTDDASRYFEL